MSTPPPRPRTPKLQSSVQQPGEPPPFGSRFLTDESEVFAKNAWDHVAPPPTHSVHISASLARQRSSPVPAPLAASYNSDPASYWDAFYALNTSNFFKHRHWLPLEFPVLSSALSPSAGDVTILEPGCGVGNALFPLLAQNQNPRLSLIGTDYAPRAIDVLRAEEAYASDNIRAEVWDLADPSGLPPSVHPGTVDIVLLIFVLSALHPSEWTRAIKNIHSALKPGGVVLLRDYGRHDLTQLRFKAGRLMGENFYVRGDGTRVYFFSLEDLAQLFTGERILPAGTEERTEETPIEVSDPPSPSSSPSRLPAEPMPSTSIPDPSRTNSESSPPPISPAPASSESDSSLPPTDPLSTPSRDDDPLPLPLFTITQLGTDRRLLVNRKRQLKMYRVWMQGAFRKL